MTAAAFFLFIAVLNHDGSITSRFVDQPMTLPQCQAAAAQVTARIDRPVTTLCIEMQGAKA